MEVAEVQPGMQVLIHGGAGGVGSLAVQIARELGAKVSTTSTQADYCRQLGADRVIDYRTENFANAGPFDVVLDTLGGEARARSLTALKPGGVLVALSATPVPPHKVPVGVRVEKPQVQATRARLERIFDWAVSGRLRPQVTKRFALADAHDAYAAAEAPHGRGKIVLEIS
jgi:NADPH:quinone reductase-like Zn-dependent oxidoreductase